jgi:hypothetical protein
MATWLLTCRVYLSCVCTCVSVCVWLGHPWLGRSSVRPRPGPHHPPRPQLLRPAEGLGRGRKEGCVWNSALPFRGQHVPTYVYTVCAFTAHSVHVLLQLHLRTATRHPQRPPLLAPAPALRPLAPVLERRMR